MPNQLSHQAVRSLEFDLHSDEKGGLYHPPLIWKLSNLTNGTTPFDGGVFLKPGLKVFHITDIDVNAVCHTFVECLTQLKDWSDSNGRHVPILIDLELKTEAPACALGGVCSGEATNWTLSHILNVDNEILSVLPREQLIVPDDVRVGNLTLEESVLQHGWPLLEEARGRFMFFFDNDPSEDPDSPAKLYTADVHESLQDRVVFTNGVEGKPDAAFIKHNNPVGSDLADIQRQVKKGYIVRTRADDPISTVLNRDATMRDNAFESGAQIVSTDFLAYGMAARWGWDYAVSLSGLQSVSAENPGYGMAEQWNWNFVAGVNGRVARCNPVIAPEGCTDAELE